MARTPSRLGSNDYPDRLIGWVADSAADSAVSPFQPAPWPPLMLALIGPANTASM